MAVALQGLLVDCVPVWGRVDVLPRECLDELLTSEVYLLSPKKLIRGPISHVTLSTHSRDPPSSYAAKLKHYLNPKSM